jgi:hypothetical protein
VEAPDLVTVKGIFCLYIAISYGRIVAKPTVDSIDTNVDWFFAGFAHVTGTEINRKDRGEVNKVLLPTVGSSHYHWAQLPHRVRILKN